MISREKCDRQVNPSFLQHQACLDSDQPCSQFEKPALQSWDSATRPEITFFLRENQWFPVNMFPKFPNQPTDNHWYPPGKFLTFWSSSHRRVCVIFLGMVPHQQQHMWHKSHSREISLQAFSFGICNRYNGAAFSQNSEEQQFILKV